MNTTPPPATTPDLSPAEEAWLRQFLIEARARAPDTLSLEELHGFLFAIVSAPDLIMPSEWIPTIFDSDTPVFRDEAEAARFHRVAMARWSSIDRRRWPTCVTKTSPRNRCWIS